jgi:hypothetical protein
MILSQHAVCVPEGQQAGRSSKLEAAAGVRAANCMLTNGVQTAEATVSA